jgi:hypothetical protein
MKNITRKGRQSYERRRQRRKSHRNLSAWKHIEPKPKQPTAPFTAALRFPNGEVQVAKEGETTHAQMFDRLFNREKHTNLISEYDPEVDVGFVDSKAHYYSREDISSHLGCNADTFGGVENRIRQEQAVKRGA